MRIAHNLIIDRARRADHEILVDTVDDDWRDDSYSVDAEAVCELASTRDELLDALVRLPYIYRSAVILHDIEEHRVVDIATIHDISLPAAKQRLRRGRMALVSALAEGHERRADRLSDRGPSRRLSHLSAALRRARRRSRRAESPSGSRFRDRPGDRETDPRPGVRNWVRRG